MIEIDLGEYRLRSFRESDRTSLLKYADNPRVSTHLMDRFPNPYREEDAELWMEHVLSQDPEAVLAIADSEELIGCIGLELKEDVYRQSAELGYWLAEPFWGKGIATRAAVAIVKYAFRELGLKRVYAGVFASNPASARVLVKAGFQLEGRLRNHVTKQGRVMDLLMYGRLPEDESESPSSRTR